MADTTGSRTIENVVRGYEPEKISQEYKDKVVQLTTLLMHSDSKLLCDQALAYRRFYQNEVNIINRRLTGEDFYDGTS